MPHHIFFIFKSNLRTLPVQTTSTAANLDCLQTHLITFHLYFFKIWSISLKIFNALTPYSTPQKSVSSVHDGGCEKQSCGVSF